MSHHLPAASRRTIAITGASDGIGAAASRLLYRTRPHDTLIVIGRNRAKTKSIARELGAEYFTADFSHLSEVRELADKLQKYPRIDALANNAGGIFDGPHTTDDGFELTWQVNVVAPFLLTSLLQDTLRASEATVVQTASVANYFLSKFDISDPNTFDNFTPERAYGNSKLGSILLTRYLHLRGLNSVAFHPGVLATNFSSNSTGKLQKFYASPVAQNFLKKGAPGGSHLAYYLTGAPGIHFSSGEYYNDKRKKGARRAITKDPQAVNHIFDDLARRLDVEW